jgi:hypothetical protein
MPQTTVKEMLVLGVARVGLAMGVDSRGDGWPENGSTTYFAFAYTKEIGVRLKYRVPRSPCIDQTSRWFLLLSVRSTLSETACCNPTHLLAPSWPTAFPSVSTVLGCRSFNYTLASGVVLRACESRL